jgi:hypothetical protein
MKISLKLIILFTGLFSVIVSCQPGNKKKVANLSPVAHQVTAEEVIQTTSYTYVRVLADERDYWIAITKMDVKEGETYFWSVGTPMKDFSSKELKRTFPVIFFVQDFTDVPITLDQQVMPSSTMPGSQMPASSMAGKQQAPEKTGIKVKLADGGISISDLYAKRSSFAGKSVMIRGEVVKYSPGIMYKNWVHLQDGTKDGDNYDLTVTTLDSVEVGDVVVFKGSIAVNKDFGAGYTYDVIMEDAKRMKK